MGESNKQIHMFVIYNCDSSTEETNERLGWR